MRFYLDSVILIYLVESVEPFAQKAESRLSGQGVEKITSSLSLLETKVMPLRLKNGALLLAFDEYFRTALRPSVEISHDVLESSAQLRAKYRSLKTPDAIHLASALQARCDVFYTNDHRLDRITEIAVETLE